MSLLQRMVEVVAPLECLSCGREGEIVCARCLQDFVITKRPTCWRCNQLTSKGQTCSRCRHHSALSGVTVASHYEGRVQELIHHLKYHHLRAASTVAAKLLAPLLASSSYDMVTSVPATPLRQRLRGYNQAELIARQVAIGLALPYRPTLFRRERFRQVGATRRQRLEQVRGSFGLISPHRVRGRSILIVDDVLTTGATMSECAGVLKAAGAARLWGAVLAKH